MSNGLSDQNMTLIAAAGGAAIGYFLLGDMLPAIGPLSPQLVGAAAGGVGGYIGAAYMLKQQNGASGTK